MLRTFLVNLLGPGAGGEGVLWFKEFALNFCLCLFFYLSINVYDVHVQNGQSFFCISKDQGKIQNISL